jgi:hypothetical protein
MVKGGANTKVGLKIVTFTYSNRCGASGQCVCYMNRTDTIRTVRVNVIMRRVRVTSVAMENQ